MGASARVHGTERLICGVTNSAQRGELPPLPDTSKVDLLTVVVGAGPAGLLFAIVAKLMHERHGGKTNWPILVVDKRSEYQRTHRLRIAPERYVALGKELADSRFDVLLAFLEAEGFTPAVNQLERQLQSLADQLGVVRERLTVGNEPGQTSLDALRARAIAHFGGDQATSVTIVGADSVHSMVRELVGSPDREHHTHQIVARFLVRGDDLPDGLNLVTHYQMAKLVSSVIDYRLNPNGYAEVDMFLDGSNVAELARFDASPSQPVTLSSADVADLSSHELRRILQHLRHGLTVGEAEIQLQSTFMLEHAYSTRIAFPDTGVGYTAFLVGDAALSLPFFRGMSAMAGLVHALATAHIDILEASSGAIGTEVADITRLASDASILFHLGTKPLPGSIAAIEPTSFDGVSAAVILHRWLGLYGVHVVAQSENDWRSLHRHAPMRRAPAEREFAAIKDPTTRYELRSAQIRDEELRVVTARSRLIRGAREFARISAMLPFPIQTWLLSVRSDEGSSDSPNPLNLSIALVAATLALIGPPLSLLSPGLMVFWWLALPVQMIGGFVYRASLTLDAGGDRSSRRVWLGQIASVAVLGLAIALVVRVTTDQWIARSSFTWLLLGFSFVPGIYLFEALDRRWFRAARLD